MICHGNNRYLNTKNQQMCLPVFMLEKQDSRAKNRRFFCACFKIGSCVMASFTFWKENSLMTQQTQNWIAKHSFYKQPQEFNYWRASHESGCRTTLCAWFQPSYADTEQQKNACEPRAELCNTFLRFLRIKKWLKVIFFNAVLSKIN